MAKRNAPIRFAFHEYTQWDKPHLPLYRRQFATSCEVIDVATAVCIFRTPSKVRKVLPDVPHTLPLAMYWLVMHNHIGMQGGNKLMQWARAQGVQIVVHELGYTSLYSARQ